MSKVIIVWTNHAWTSAAKTLLNKHKWDLTLHCYDTNTNISFLGCGMALWIGGEISDPQWLFYSSPEQLTSMGAKIMMAHQVESIDTQAQTITVRNLNTWEVFEDNYDHLILSCGSVPVRPPIPGIELDNIISVKLFQDAQRTIDIIANPEIQDAVVVGAWYIGIELAEALQKHGKKVTMVDMESEIMPRYYDRAFTQAMEQQLTDHGISLELGQTVQSFGGSDGKVTHIVTNEKEIKADIVMFSIWFKPNTAWLRESTINLAPNGAVCVNQYQQTNIPNVYAIGDGATIFNNTTQSDWYIALASNAVRTGMVAAHHIVDQSLTLPGVQWSNGIHIYNLYMWSCGLTEREALKAWYPVVSHTLTSQQRPAFIHDNYDVTIKVVYREDTKLLMWVQISCDRDIHHIIHLFSLAIQQQMTVDQLALMDLFFLPHCNKPLDPIAQVLLECQ
jgi:NADPH-dependent 2,4-dienoyl-CoA reductase/sulfur reductase-like enzyme